MTSQSHTVKLSVPVRGANLDSNGQVVAPVAGATAAPQKVAAESTRPVLDEDHLCAVFDQLNERLQQLEISRRQSVAVINQVTVELAVTIAGKILFQQIDAEQFPMAEMISEMLTQVDSTEPVAVHVNPRDLKLIHQVVQSDDVKFPELEHVKWVASPELPRGSARLDVDKFALFYNAATQLSEIRQNLMEMLYDAEIERRKPDHDGAGLRRFPDRRASG